MKRKFDIFSILAIIFTLWYLFTTSVYILSYYLENGFASLVGENISYPIMLIATLGGLFKGEAHSILIAWSPILAVVMGASGYFNRDKACKDFIILPCICLIAPLLMVIVPSGAFLGLLFEVLPYASLTALIVWVVVDLLMIVKDRKA